MISKKPSSKCPRQWRNQKRPLYWLCAGKAGFFKDDETVQVNYRIQGNRYIVDTVFDSAILIAGVGGNQDAVAIKRVKK